jgi:hypothetical protein
MITGRDHRIFENARATWRAVWRTMLDVADQHIDDE